MSRVITFSRTFPAYHPRAGEPTYFVEKILLSIPNHLGCEMPLSVNMWDDFEPKHHTIRAGHRWKVGDWFSPRVWSGKPYKSKMITIAPDIQVKKVWNIEMRFEQTSPVAIIEGRVIMFDEFKTLAANDGLTTSDMMAWFKKTMEGQIICWNDQIEYLCQDEEINQIFE